MKVEIIENKQGIVHRGRLARPGDVVDVDEDVAMQMLEFNEAFLHVRLRLLRDNIMVDVSVYSRGDVIDVPYHRANHLIEARAADLPELRIKAASANVDGEHFPRGKVVSASLKRAAELISRGDAEWALAPTIFAPLTTKGGK